MPRMAGLGLALLLGGALPVCGEPDDPLPATPSAAVLDDPWQSPDIAPRMDARPLQRSDTPRPPAMTARGEEPVGPPWARTTLALGGVVALILLLAWGYRRMAAGSLGLTLRSRSAVVLEVVGRTTLAPRQAVYLVRVGPRLVLLGCTADAIRPLDVIADPDLTARLLGQAAAARPASATAEFAQCLEHQAGQYKRDEEDVPEDTLSPNELRLRAVRQRLSGTIERLRATVA